MANEARIAKLAKAHVYTKKIVPCEMYMCHGIILETRVSITQSKRWSL